MSLKSLKVGEDVMLSNYRGSRRVPVEKVGRKWITAGGARFWLEDGRGDFGHVETLADFDARCAREEAVRALAALGVDLRHGSPARKRAVEVREMLRPMLEPTPTGGGADGR